VGEFLDIIKIVWPLIIFQLLLMIWAIIDLAKRKTVKSLPKWAWALIVIFVNTFGPIVYLVFGRGEE
jgi:hypothetical protein